MKNTFYQLIFIEYYPKDNQYLSRTIISIGVVSKLLYWKRILGDKKYPCSQIEDFRVNGISGWFYNAYTV